MNDTNVFERFVADQFDRARDAAQATSSSLDAIATQATRTRQRPRWLAIIKEPPMRYSSKLAVGSPMARVAALMVATLLIVLSVAGAGFAGAQLFAAEEEQEGYLSEIPAVPFTGNWIGAIDGVGAREMEWVLGPGYALAPEMVEHEGVVTFEATDPRIGGEWTQVNDMRSFAMWNEVDEDPFVTVSRSAVRIENEDGAWAGTIDFFKAGDDTGPEWYHLVGEGDYEGLTALFRWIPETDVYDGVIFPGVPPDYPPPIAVADAVPAE